MSFFKKTVWIPSLSGFIYGYNSSIIAGALLFLTLSFSLTHFQQGLVVGVGFLGTCLACFSGILSNYFGRKRLLQTSSLLCILGCIMSVFAPHISILLLGRFLVGAACGSAIIVAPIYLVETASKENRGSILNFNQIGNATGTLLAYACGYFFAREGNWRGMFGLGLIPATVQLMGLFFIPDSCSPEERLKKREAASWKHVWDLKYRPRFRLALFLAFCQVLSGSAAVFYFAPRVFENVAAHDPETALLATVSIGVIYLIGICVSFWMVDRLGRRPLLFLSLGGMAMSYLAISLSGFLGVSSLDGITRVSLLFYVGFYAIGMGPLPSLITSEISPFSLRGHLMTLMGTTIWISSYLVAITFLPLVQFLGILVVFALYAFFCLSGLILFSKLLPETKQKSLEEIDKLF